MSSTVWVGGFSNDPSNAANWTAGKPTSTKSAIFTSPSNNNCDISQLVDVLNIEIKEDFDTFLTTSGTVTIDVYGYLIVSAAGKIKPTHAVEFEFQNAPTYGVFDSGGSAYAHKPHVIIDNVNVGSMFGNETARANTTFDFGSTTFTMIDGVYPNIEGTGTLYSKSIYSNTARSLHNSYGSVDMLAVNGINVRSENFDIHDYHKSFNFEGALTSLGQFFQFGFTSAGFVATASGSVFPSIGELNSNAFGHTASKTFYSQFHKVVIKNGGTSNYYKINIGRFLDCNELVIEDGGRFYGPSSGVRAACIRTVKRPTIHGDWNFRQLSDGIYESINDISNLPVSHGGTGLAEVSVGGILYGNGNGTLSVLPIGSTGQTLKVSSSGVPEWVT